MGHMLPAENYMTCDWISLRTVAAENTFVVKVRKVCFSSCTKLALYFIIKEGSTSPVVTGCSLKVILKVKEYHILLWFVTLWSSKTKLLSVS